MTAQRGAAPVVRGRAGADAEAALQGDPAGGAAERTRADSKPRVVAVHCSARHEFVKRARTEIALLAGLGVEGDAHCGATVRNRYLARRNPGRPNLRQVHLIESELLDELLAQGISLPSGALGENISTRGIRLAALGRGTRLRIGERAVIEVTGLREPCVQIERQREGLKARVAMRGAGGVDVVRAGVMAIVVSAGVVRGGDDILVAPPPEPYLALAPV